MRKTTTRTAATLVVWGWATACANPHPPTLNQKCFYDEDCDAGQFCAIGDDANDGLCRAVGDAGSSEDTGSPDVDSGPGDTDPNATTTAPSTSTTASGSDDPISTSNPSESEGGTEDGSEDDGGSSSGSGTGGEASCLGVPPADAIDYANPLTIEIPANPQGIATGDLDLDDALDLIVTSRDEGTATVFVGDGFGNFSPSETTDTGEFVGAVRIGAIADATPDIVVHQQFAANVRRLRGVGDGSFGNVQTLGASSGGLELTDLDGDEVLDLLTTDGPNVSVALGTVVAETFLAPVGYPAGLAGNPSRLALADFDGNGTRDVAALSGGQFVVLLGNGAGALAAQVPRAVGAPAGAIGAGDFDSDGQADVAVVTAGGGTDAARVFWGSGAGTFEAVESVLGTQAAPTGVAAADVDADGDDDLVVTHATGALGIHLSDGAGGFAPQQSFPCSNNLREIAIGDFNDDCVLDVASVSSGAALLCIWLSQ